MARHQTLSGFFTAMAKSPENRKDYREDPRGFILRSKLSPTHKKLILSGDAKKIGAMLIAEHLSEHPAGDSVEAFFDPPCCLHAK